MRLVSFCAAAAFVAATAPASAQIALGPGALVIRVSDAAGRPLAGAVVEANGPASREAESNAAGVVTMAALPTGTYDVSVSLAGYASWSTQVAVRPVTMAPSVLTTQLASSSLANLGNAASVLALPELGAGLDPFAAHALTANAATNVVAGAGGAAISLDGTLPGESRVELDGIPLAGGASSPATVRFRDLLGLSGIDVDAGPDIVSPSVRDAIGGIVNLRTPGLGGSRKAGLDAGYDSAFGSFQHLRGAYDFGSLSVAFDSVSGGTTDRSQSLHGSYAFAPGSSAEFAAYDLQAAGAVGLASVSAVAPAYSAGLHVRLGGGALEARLFGSSLLESVAGASPFARDETARAKGLQLNYQLPLGADGLQFSFDRRSENTFIAATSPVDQTFSTFVARGQFALARPVRLELADAYSGGTLLPARNDPQIALLIRPTAKLSVRVAAGSDFATAPDALLAERSGTAPQLAPETAFGYRAGVDDRPDAHSRVWFDAYDERRYDLFAPLPDATNRGAGAGYERTPARGFGAVAYLALEHSDAFGTPQLPFRYQSDATPLVPGAQLAGDPFAKARLALTYRSSPTCEDSAGVTILGANNALASRSVALGSVALCAQFFGAFDVHVGEENLFGAVVRDTLLAPLYQPHEFTFSLGTR